MSKGVHRQIYPPNSIIFSEDEPGECAYFITKGRVEIAEHKDGERKVLAVLQDGELFGEMALLDSLPRVASATAIDETELVLIDRELVKGKMSHADPLIGLFVRVILHRYRTLEKSPKQVDVEHSVEALLPSYEQGKREILDQLKVKGDLRTAIENGEFRLFYQPIIDLQNREIKGFEALIRWFHPQRGLVPPDEFISIAEDTGLIVPLGLWILQQACLDLTVFMAQQQTQGAAPLFMSVNLSARQISDPSLLNEFAKVLENIALNPQQIKLEITESLLMENPTLAAQALTQLKGLGVSIAIDDFGTGFSSLSYLHRFPIDAIKIDRSFTQSIGDNQRSLTIVRAISSLARSLDMQVIVEGIETEDALETVKQFGCEFGQGYLISKPVPIESARGLIQTAVH